MESVSLVDDLQGLGKTLKEEGTVRPRMLLIGGLGPVPLPVLAACLFLFPVFGSEARFLQVLNIIEDSPTNHTMERLHQDLRVK